MIPNGITGLERVNVEIKSLRATLPAEIFYWGF
jgi:hypothetical protein